MLCDCVQDAGFMTSAAKRYMGEQDVADWLERHEIMNKVRVCVCRVVAHRLTAFAPNTHLQVFGDANNREIISRSQPIIQFLCSSNRLSNDYLDLIWAQVALSGVVDTIIALNEVRACLACWVCQGLLCACLCLATPPSHVVVMHRC